MRYGKCSSRLRPLKMKGGNSKHRPQLGPPPMGRPPKPVADPQQTALL